MGKKGGETAIEPKHEDKAYASRSDNPSSRKLANVVARLKALLNARIASVSRNTFSELCKLVCILAWVWGDGVFCIFGGLLIFHIGTMGSLGLVLVTNLWIYVLLKRNDVRRMLKHLISPDQWNNMEDMEKILSELAKTQHAKEQYAA